MAIEAVAATGHADSVAALLQLTREQEVRARREAVWALSQVPDISAVAALEQLIHDPDMMVREGAFRGLAKQGGTRAYEVLLQGLDDPLEMVRITVIHAVAEQKLAAAVPRLAERMKVADLPEQGVIIDALMKIGTDDAMAVLADLVEHGTEQQRMVASNALQRMNERELLESVFLDDEVRLTRNGRIRSRF